MKKKLLSGRLPIVLSVFGLGLMAVLAFSFWGQTTEAGRQGETGRLDKLVASGGTVTMHVDLTKAGAKAAPSEVHFAVQPDTFFTIVTFNDELRGSLPSAMTLEPRTNTRLPEPLNSSLTGLTIESMPWGSDYELIVRDANNGFEYFGIEGHQFNYDGAGRSLGISGGRLVLTEAFASALGDPKAAGTVVGDITIDASMRTIESTIVDNGQIVSEELPSDPNAGTVPGPDVMVGDLNGLAQFGGQNGDYVGLAVGTDSCNFGTENLHWQALPSNDHPVIPQNMYRMSGGADNTERFEQIGQSSVKHEFTAITQNLCSLGCNGVGGGNLGSGCSDPYVASLNAGPSLGSRAWINPFTGFFPRGDSSTPPNDHTGHNHSGNPAVHRMYTKISDLSASLNAGATYYAEAQYITPHEYSWCQTHPDQCNMYNNVSYRRYNVSGTGSPFSFSAAQATQRGKAAISAWPGASLVPFEPEPGVDGIGTVAYRVTNPSSGVWHYEYAVYNQNIDRGIRTFAIPVGSGVSITNIGFHAPPQQPGSTFDGTFNNQGFSNTPWSSLNSGGSLEWSTETLAQNPNAIAIRWGTMYNFRFDSDQPPVEGIATLGFFKTGSPINVAVMVPSGSVAAAYSVSGRVVSSGGAGIKGARVTITDSEGTSRTMITGTFGYYSFSNVSAGAGYTMSAVAKGMTFASHNFDVTDNITDLNFTPGVATKTR
jgi:hypothetical protein